VVRDGRGSVEGGKDDGLLESVGFAVKLRVSNMLQVKEGKLGPRWMSIHVLGILLLHAMQKQTPCSPCPLARIVRQNAPMHPFCNSMETHLSRSPALPPLGSLPPQPYRILTPLLSVNILVATFIAPNS